MADLEDLAATLEVLARPYLVVEPADSEIVIKVVSPAEPSRRLMTLAMRPATDNWVQRRPAVVRSFDEFNDLVARTVDRATLQDEPLGLAQQIYNQGIMLNTHGWVGVFDFEMRDVDSDISHWAHRTY